MEISIRKITLCIGAIISGCFFFTQVFSAGSQEQTNSDNSETQFSFVTCPVYRDTDAGPKSGCWLGVERETGLQFDITGALTKPFLDRAVLVEGVIKNTGSEMCGATVLEPIRISVLLDEPCPPRLIPAEGYPGRRFTPPKSRMQPNSVPRVLPAPPFDKTEFDILFNFNSDFLNYQYSEVILEALSLLIKAAKPESVVITGTAATDAYTLQDRVFKEPRDLAKRRADMVYLALTRLGIEEKILSIKTELKPLPIEHYAGGLAEETKRRVDIKLIFN